MSDTATEPDPTEGAEELAKEENIDLATIEGTGADGRVTKADVQAAVTARDHRSGSEEEHYPPIRVGQWVKLSKTGRSIPPHLRGRDAVVTIAPAHVERDGESGSYFLHNKDSDKFSVRVRDTSETLEITTAQIEQLGDHRLDLVMP